MNRVTYFQTRLSPDDRREVLWQSLYRNFFSRLIAEKDCVLDLGAGYEHFINQVTARKAIALDAWGGFVDWLRPGIELVIRLYLSAPWKPMGKQMFIRAVQE